MPSAVVFRDPIAICRGDTISVLAFHSEGSDRLFELRWDHGWQPWIEHEGLPGQETSSGAVVDAGSSRALVSSIYFGVYIWDPKGAFEFLPYSGPPHTDHVSRPTGVSSSGFSWEEQRFFMMGDDTRLWELCRQMQHANPLGEWQEGWKWEYHGCLPAGVRATRGKAPSAVKLASGAICVFVGCMNGHIYEFLFDGWEWGRVDHGVPWDPASPPVPDLAFESLAAWRVPGVGQQPEKYGVCISYFNGEQSRLCIRRHAQESPHPWQPWHWSQPETWGPVPGHHVVSTVAVMPDGGIYAFGTNDELHLYACYSPDGAKWSWVDCGTPPTGKRIFNPTAVGTHWGYLGAFVGDEDGNMWEVYNDNGWVWESHGGP